MEEIRNSDSNVTVTGTAEAALITNSGNKVTIEAGSGDDKIYNSGNSVSIHAGNGNNSVSIDSSAGGYQTIVAGTGNNTVEVGERDETEEKRYYNRISIEGGDNYINNSNVERSTIFAGAGNDSIITGGGKNGYVLVNAGSGDNQITVNSYAEDGEVYASGGNDLVSVVSGTANIISVSGGDDSVITGVGNSTINVGAGKNFVSLNSGSNSIIAGGGDDLVTITNGNDNISLGGGNNTLASPNRRQTVYAGDGDDSVIVWGGYINAGGGANNVSITYGGTTTIYSGADDDIVNVADKEETEETRSKNYISAGDGNNFVNNSNVEESTIIAGSGNDTIITGGGKNGYVLVNAGSGDNQITVNSSMTYGEVYAKGGNDLVSISGGGTKNIISVSGGDDSVIVDIGNSTINVGAGKNFVSLSSGGNSIIAGDNDDLVTITAGNSNYTSLGEGNNTLSNYNGRETIYAGDGDDSITVWRGYMDVGGGQNDISLTGGGYTTIYAGSGDDIINVADVDSERQQNYISAGDGNNFVNNSNVEGSTIIAGSGNDTIITGGGGYYKIGIYDQTSISAGAGDNKITVNSAITYGRIYAGAGNDLVSLSGNGNYNIISVGNGRNTIITNDYYDTSYNIKNTIEAGNGSDLIRTSGNTGFINAGSGRNLISLTGGYNNTIITGKGNDTIMLAENANNNVIIFGGGNDIVYNYHAGDTIRSAGVLSKMVVGNDVILTDAQNTMTLLGAASKTINTATLSSNDDVYKILVADQTAGDSLLPDGSAITVPPDTTPAFSITNTIKNSSVTGSDFNDYLGNVSNNVTISGLGDSDTINNTGAKVYIDAGAGSDLVDNFGKQVTIAGGTGNDNINNRGSNVVIFGNDGDDIINNFGGDDGYGDSVTVEGGTGNDLIVNSGKNVLFNYNAGDGNDTITGFNDSSVLQIVEGTYNQSLNGNDLIVTVGENSITLKNVKDLSLLADGDQIYKPTWRLNGSTATYGSPNKVLVTISGVKSLNGISLSGNVVTLSKSALGSDRVTVSGGYTLALANDVTNPTTKTAWNVNNTIATYKQTVTQGYTLASDKKFITYTPNSTATLVTIKGLKQGLKVSNGAISGITLSGKKVTVAASALGTKKVTISDGYTLALGSDVTKPTKTKAWSINKTTATYKETTSAGYVCDNSTITYSKEASSTLLTVKGVKSGLAVSNGKINGITLSGKNVTVAKAALGTDKVTVSDEYTLKLGSDATKSKTTAAGWTLKGTTATYKESSTTAGYQLADNQISYVKASGGKTLATVKGVKNAKGLSLSGNVITVAKTSLGTAKITVSDGYTLKLAKDVTKSSITSAWNLSGTTATLKQTTKAGYALSADEKSITYTKAANATAATVKGVKNKSGVSMDGDVVNLKASALNKNVTVSGGNEFDFAAGNYKGAKVSGSKSADIITSNGKNISIDGGDGNDKIKVFGSATTVIGGKGNDTITSGNGENIFVYAQGDGKDVIADFAEDDKIKITKGTFKASTSGKDIIVTVGSGSIKLTGAAGQKISIIDAKGTETTYPQSANVTWFLEDDNNFDVDNQLGSLIEAKDYSSAAQIVSSKDLFKENQLITYANKK